VSKRVAKMSKIDINYIYDQEKACKCVKQLVNEIDK